MGVAEAASPERLTLYIPSADSDGKSFDPQPWIDDAMRLLSAIGGGATRMPPVEGVWYNPQSGEFITEQIVLVYSYIDPDKFEQNLLKLRQFLHAMGKHTNQGEVVFELSDVLYKIRNYPHA